MTGCGVSTQARKWRHSQAFRLIRRRYARSVRICAGSTGIGIHACAFSLAGNDSLWLVPQRQETKITEVGAKRETSAASCPAPETISRDEKPPRSTVHFHIILLCIPAPRAPRLRGARRSTKKSTSAGTVFSVDHKVMHSGRAIPGHADLRFICGILLRLTIRLPKYIDNAGQREPNLCVTSPSHHSSQLASRSCRRRSRLRRKPPTRS